MKRDVKIKDIFGNKHQTATIITDKNGLQVENKNPSYASDDDFVSNFLRDCINMDQWQHSWHTSVREAKVQGSQERKRILEILNGKILDRERQIQELKDAKKILRLWHY